MKKKIFAITVSVLTFLSSIGWASELEKNELDEVVAFANKLGVYDCYDFKGAYRHPKMNQVYTVGEHSIYNIVCILGASNFGWVGGLVAGAWLSGVARMPRLRLSPSRT